MTLDTTAPKQLGVYDILSKIAEGGMGTVYKGKNRNTGEIVAVKVIAAATAKNPILLQRFEREFLAAQALDHPNVVKAIDYSDVMPHPFLVMEFVDGESIGQRIEQRGAYPEAEAVRLIAQVCDGLQQRPQAGAGPPRREAGQHPGHPRGGGEADRPGAGEGGRGRPEPDPDRPRAGHARTTWPRSSSATPRRWTSAATSTRSAPPCTRWSPAWCRSTTPARSTAG